MAELTWWEFSAGVMNVDHLIDQEYSLTHRSTLIGLQIIQRMGNAKQSSYFHQQGQMFSSMVSLPNVINVYLCILNPGLNGPCKKIEAIIFISTWINYFMISKEAVLKFCRLLKILQRNLLSRCLLMWIHTYKHTYSHSLSSVKFCLDFEFP